MTFFVDYDGKVMQNPTDRILDRIKSCIKHLIIITYRHQKVIHQLYFGE
jgi:hypothetical protein